MIDSYGSLNPEGCLSVVWGYPI